MKKKYQPTQREHLVLDEVENPKYDRQIVNGLDPFMSGSAPEEFRNFYTDQEISKLDELRGTDRDVEARMPVKLTRHYFEMAKTSPALQKLVKASPDETVDLEGDPDPANQLDYSPIEGLLHKYEMALLYVISTCSAHCRFCYREELIGRKEIERSDGTLKKKGLAQVGDITEYIRTHNAAVAANDGAHPETGRAEAARDPAVGRRPHGAPELQTCSMVHGTCRGRCRGDPRGHEGIGFLPGPLR